MPEYTEQTHAEPGVFPARIQLNDFIEAVTRGVARMLAAPDALLALAEPAPPPANFRTAAPAAQGACLHFPAGNCDEDAA